MGPLISRDAISVVFFGVVFSSLELMEAICAVELLVYNFLVQKRSFGTSHDNLSKLAHILRNVDNHNVSYSCKNTCVTV